MTNAAKRILSLLVIALALSCTPHRPWDRSVPAAARTRWRLGQDIFSSVARDVKLMDPRAVTQEPAVRRAAEAALLSLTAHARLPADPARDRRLLGQLERAGFTFAASRLRAPARPFEPDDRHRLATRDWTRLGDLPLTTERVRATGSGRLQELIRTHLHDPSGAVAIWALELARREDPAGHQGDPPSRRGDTVRPERRLDCAAWQTIALSAVKTHSERALSALWPALKQACTLDELQAWTEALDGRLPELERLFGELAGFGRQVRVCVTTGARFPAAGLREAFLRLPAPEPEDLALGLLCSDEDFLAFSSPDPVIEALRLHLAGRTGDALAGLQDRAPASTPAARLQAGRLALAFGDRDAAAGNFRWAAAGAEVPALRAAAYAWLRVAARFTAEEEWTALAEQFRLDPAGCARQLWLDGHWPALVFLSGRAPIPWSDDARRALAGYAACHPGGGDLAPHWKRLMGEARLKAVWPASDPERPCRLPTAPVGPTKESGKPARADPWQGDFHSDLARLLHESRPPADWEAFFSRHGTHLQAATVAELAALWHPDSFPHLRAAATAFLLRGEPDRAWNLLTPALAAHSDQATAIAELATWFLRAGYRHEATRAMRDWLVWHEAFSTPEERARSDWRLEPRLALVGFLWQAGYPGEAGSRLSRLLADARTGDPLRLSRVAALAARQFPAFASPGQVLQTTGSPLTLLRLAPGRPGWEKTRDHVLTQLAILLPGAPEVAWLACVWRDRPDACLDAETLGVDPPGGVRLPVLLPLLDRLQNLDTDGQPPAWRLARHAARRRAVASSPGWRFVEEAISRHEGSPPP